MHQTLSGTCGFRLYLMWKKTSHSHTLAYDLHIRYGAKMHSSISTVARCRHAFARFVNVASNINNIEHISAIIVWREQFDAVCLATVQYSEIVIENRATNEMMSTNAKKCVPYDHNSMPMNPLHSMRGLPVCVYVWVPSVESALHECRTATVAR